MATVPSTIDAISFVYYAPKSERSTIEKHGIEPKPVKMEDRKPGDKPPAPYLRLFMKGNNQSLFSMVEELGDVDVWQVKGLMSTQAIYSPDRLAEKPSKITAVRWRNSLIDFQEMGYVRNIPKRNIKLIGTFSAH